MEFVPIVKRLPKIHVDSQNYAATITVANEIDHDNTAIQWVINLFKPISENDIPSSPADCNFYTPQKLASPNIVTPNEPALGISTD